MRLKLQTEVRGSEHLPPKLLILDEVTNNLDLESRTHVIQVLKAYPGALLVVSHDEDFLVEIGINDYYRLPEGKFEKL